MLKRLISAMVCISMMAIIFAGCGSTPAADSSTSSTANSSTDSTAPSEKHYKIGFSNASVSNTWRVAMYDMMKEEAAKHPEIELLYTDANDNTGKQNSDVDDLLAKGIDALLISPSTEAALNPAIEKAFATGIPVIVFDRRPTTDKYTTFVVTDDVINGQLSAQRLVDQLTKKNGSAKGNVALIQAFMGSGPQIDRFKGINDVLSKYPDIKIVADQPADFQRAKGQSVMENILMANKEIDAVISESGESLAGALDAMKVAKRLDGMIIENVDGYNGILKAIKNGVVDSTSLFPASLGKEALLATLKVLNGEKLEKLTKLPNIQVTKDNVDQYVDMNADDGKWTY
ncbi:MAG: substrate-binding domain-containing protein [Ruminiclostridium sp.]